MPSLRERVSTYFRQLSFVREDRYTSRNFSGGSFITKYLETGDGIRKGPEIYSGKDPTMLPDLTIDKYDVAHESIKGALTGPGDGCLGIKRSKLHLSAGSDIDFIDTIGSSSDDFRQLATSSSQVLRKQKNLNSSDQNANTNVKNSIQTQSNRICEDNVTSKEILLENDETKTPDSLNQNKSISNLEKLVHESINEITMPVEGINWKQSTDDSYGLAVSLYEKNPITEDYMGSPIADSFGILSRSNSCILVLADGVNWGENAKLAARAATFGCLEYLNTAIFGQTCNQRAATTREVFISLLRSFWEAHATILETGGSLTTLTAAVVLPLHGDEYEGKFVLCCCNVGDSFGYVYSKTYGVREVTKDSHDIQGMRDLRNALGALGPVNGNKPELSNLTLSMTICEGGDIIFLTSDGVSDNFDPVVGKFAEPMPITVKENKVELPPSQKKVGATSNASNRLSNTTTTPAKKGTGPIPPARKKKILKNDSPGLSNELTNNKTTTSTLRPKYLRSQTFIEPRKSRILSKSNITSNILRSAVGLPYVTGTQRYELSLLRMFDLFSYGINGTLRLCTTQTAKRVCHLLIDFAKMITTAKRKMLEQTENFYKISINENGERKQIPMSRNQQRSARKKIIEGGVFSTLPGKLDHASCVAWKVPQINQTTLLSIHTDSNFKETDF